MSKSLATAKVLGGGILGGGSIVGAGYGLNKYFKSEENTDASTELSTEPTKETTDDTQEGDAIENPGDNTQIANQDQPVVKPPEGDNKALEGSSDSETRGLPEVPAAPQGVQTDAQQESDSAGGASKENTGGVQSSASSGPSTNLPSGSQA